jgi:hypothetical protein
MIVPIPVECLYTMAVCTKRLRHFGASQETGHLGLGKLLGLVRGKVRPMMVVMARGTANPKKSLVSFEGRPGWLAESLT